MPPVKWPTNKVRPVAEAVLFALAQMRGEQPSGLWFHARRGLFVA